MYEFDSRAREYGRWYRGAGKVPTVRSIPSSKPLAGRYTPEMLSKGPPLLQIQNWTCPEQLSVASELLNTNSLMAQWQIVIVTLLLCARTEPTLTWRHALTAPCKPCSLPNTVISDAQLEALTDLLGKICMWHVTGPDMFQAQSSTTAPVIPSKTKLRGCGNAVHVRV